MPADWTTRRLTFETTGDARLPWAATVDGYRLTVRVNEFPEEPTLYSLLVDDAEPLPLETWPVTWTRPDDGDAHERAEYEHELTHFARTKSIPPKR